MPMRQKVCRKLNFWRLARWLGALIVGLVAGLAIVLGCILALDIGLAAKPDLWGGLDFSRVFVDRSGNLLRVTLSADEKYRIYTPLNAIPAEMQEATLLYEDRSFWDHLGVNFGALGRAMVQMARGGRRMGASTITMQVVRLTGKFRTDNIPGKLRQIRLALILERHYSKVEILEAYLNLAPYGANVEGVGAAARVWFAKDAAQLTVPEILALVTVPQNPAARNPLAQQGKALHEARLRLNALWKEVHPADKLDLFAQVPLQVYGPGALPREAPHFVNSLLSGAYLETGLAQYYPASASLLPPAAEGAARLVNGNSAGLYLVGRPELVQTSLDLAVQKTLEIAVTRAVSRGGLWGMQNAAAMLVHWPSMEVRALAGSADFYNNAIQGQVDGTAARRSPGSTLKPFIYALALEQGLIHPQTVLLDAPRVFRGYRPENADSGFRGPLSARLALQGSRNIPAISLASQLRAPNLYDFLVEAGVVFAQSADHYGLALVLGGAEVTMRELVRLYAMLPNRGVWRDLVFLPGSAAQAAVPRRLLLPEAAFTAMDMLRAPSPSGFDRVAAYWKTGTSNGQRDAWSVGVFGPYVLAVWVGNFDSTPNPGFTGLNAAAPLFFDIVQMLNGRERLADLPRQNLNELNLSRVTVCAATGDINIKLCPERGKQVETWFIPGVSPIQDSGILREIIVDAKSGLRQCQDIPGITERVVWEFWPADARGIFAKAGVNKLPPPDFAPECQGYAITAGKAPAISSPQAGVIYSRSLSHPDKIPLLADTESDDDVIFWFAGSLFLGRSAAGEPLLWDPPPGVTRLRAVDELGRADSLWVVVETAP